MKKGRHHPPRYQHHHFTMESSTQDYLRKAAAEALAAKDDGAVIEILAMLRGVPIAQGQDQQIRLLPSTATTADGPAHDFHYWSQFIRDSFIPFLTENGRVRFTSPELFSWIERCAEARFTSGDLLPNADGAATWRRGVSNGLINLKTQGVVHAETRGRSYQICAVSHRSTSDIFSHSDDL
jgi:hypothetical protein